MRKASIIVFLCGTLLALGCGDKKSGGDSKKAEPGQDWSGAALKPVEETVDGVKFQIDIPEKMKLDDNEADRKSWRADMDDYFSEPSVRISTVATAPKTLEEATKHYMVDDKNVIARKDEVSGGFLVSHHSPNKGLLYAVFFKPLGGKTFVCSASQAKTGGVPNFEKTKEWLEKICLSLTAK